MSPYPHAEEKQSRYKKTCYIQLFHSRYIMAFFTCWFHKYNRKRSHLDTSQEDQEMAQKQRTNVSVVHIHRASKM